MVYFLGSRFGIELVLLINRYYRFRIFIEEKFVVCCIIVLCLGFLGKVD